MSAAGPPQGARPPGGERRAAPLGGEHTSAPRQLDVFACELDGLTLIEASAGTGKTWNICALYLRLLLERGLAVQDILVVTFTNAATAELRERVRARIVETLELLRAGESGAAAETQSTFACSAGGTGALLPASAAAGDAFVLQLVNAIERRTGATREALAKRLDEALQFFDEAAIFTIHGFCQRALADASFSAGMPFTLELVADAGEMTLAAVRDFWRLRVASDACPPALAAHLVERGDSPEHFARLLARGLAKPLAKCRWPGGVDLPAKAHGAPATGAPALLDLSALETAYAAAAGTWAARRESIVDTLKQSLPALHAQPYKATTVDAAAREWDAWFRETSPLACPRKGTKLDLYSRQRLLRCTKKGQATPEHEFFDQAAALLEAFERTERELALARLRLVRELLDSVGAELRLRRRERRVIAFDDMLHNLHEALEAPGGDALAASLRARFPFALIDEFQDTDPLQFAIFGRLYGTPEASAFLVGDPKQAIYSFRNADLHAYLRARGSATREYTLAHNQRSSAGLIRALNGLFSANRSAFMLAGLDYRRVETGDRLRPPFADLTLPRAALQVWMLPWGADGKPLPRKSLHARAVRATAAEIARLVAEARDGRVTLGDRPLRPGDIAILVRTHAQGSELKGELATLGIGSVELAQASVFQSADAEEVERLLVAVHQPSRETLLRGALATELIGCDAARIADISASEEQLGGYLQRFADYRETWHRRGVGVMFRQILSDERVSARMLRRPDGERRLTNLLHLGDLIHQAAATHESPDALLRWLQAQRREASTDDAVQLRLESDRNLVQIVTIHKAKGLEFPVVFCPFLWEGSAGPGVRSLEGREYHDDDGTAVIDFRSDDELGAEAAAGIAARMRLEESAERLRLIYVAVTRAVHRCYLIAGTYTTGGVDRPSMKESTRSLLHWLVAGGGTSPAGWFDESRTPEEIARAWQAWADSLAPHVGLAPLPADPGTPVPLAGPPPETLAPLPPPKSIAPPWRFSSFSSLVGDARREGAASDHDAFVPELAGRIEPPPPCTADDDILRFPTGTGAGECLHAIFERIDFTASAGWSEAIARSLVAHPPFVPGARTSARLPLLARMASRMLADVTATQLPDGIVLGTVPRTRRLTELEFSLPAPRVSPRSLAALLKRQGYEVPRLAFADVEGYLKGFIDLVFEYGGRYYVLDWKSNHLGHAAADYGPARLQAVMGANGYHLQYLLYTLALDRYLRLRLPGYARDAHLGGVLYLFVRGVRPNWVNPDGTAAGVFHHRPAPATLAALDELFAPGRSEVAQ